MDFFIDKMVKKSILDIINNKDTIPDNTAIWKSMTRLMFRNYPANEVWSWVEDISKEAYDEDWFFNKYSEEDFKKKFVEEKPKSRYVKKGNDKLKNLINSRLKITDVAKSYGLDTDKRGRTTCPFHNDSDPSCNFDDKRNVFHCFGCGIKGDIITFIRKMEELKSGDEKRGRTNSNRTSRNI